MLADTAAMLRPLLAAGRNLLLACSAAINKPIAATGTSAPIGKSANRVNGATC